MFIHILERPIVQTEGLIAVCLSPALENASRLSELPSHEHHRTGHIAVESQQRRPLQPVTLATVDSSDGRLAAFSPTAVANESGSVPKQKAQP